VIKFGDRILERANRRLAAVGLPPLLVNGLKLGSALACGVCFAQRSVLPAVLFLLAHGYLDYLEGAVRRAAKIAARAVHPAPVLHSLFDKLSDIALFLSLGWAGWITWQLSAAASAATVTATVLGYSVGRRGALPTVTCSFDRADKLFVLLVSSPFALFKSAVIVTVTMNLIVVFERTWAGLRSGGESR
jgi:hypothetical protein